MTIEAAIYSYLSSYTGLTALVGLDIYPVVVRQGVTTAAVAYQMIGDTPVHSGIADCIVHAARFQFSCYGTSYVNACAVATQVRAALQDYTGTMGGAGGVTVQRVFFEMATDLFDEELHQCGRALDFTFWHEGS